MGSLLQQIAQLDNLSAAFAKVKANKGAAGSDRISVAAFETNLERELASLRKRLLSDEVFEDCSFGFRPGRGPKAALAFSPAASGG